MRHLRQIDDYRRAGDVLAKRHRQVAAIILPGSMVEDFTKHHHLPVDIRQLDADHILPRHDSDTNRDRAHRTGDVIGKRNDTLRFCSRRRHQIMARHHRAISGFGDVTLHAEIAKNMFKLCGRVLERLFRRTGRRLAGSGKQPGRRQAELPVTIKIEAPLTGGAPGGCGAVRRRAGKQCRLLAFARRLAGCLLAGCRRCLGFGQCQGRRVNPVRISLFTARGDAARHHARHPADRRCDKAPLPP